MTGTPAVAAGSKKPQSADLHPGPGFRIRLDFPRMGPENVQGFRDFGTPDISDLLNRLYAIDPEIACLAGGPVVGLACTVRTYPGDNLMVHKVLDVARPGDVVVINGGVGRSNAVLGDIISTKAMHRGIAGFIIDGLVRDLPDVRSLGFPVYARGTTPMGPLHRGPGEINYPIACGGVVVNPGDVVVADEAGVVVVPQKIAKDLLERLRAKADTGAAYIAAVQRGEFSNAWVDDQLAAQGCPIEPYFAGDGFGGHADASLPELTHAETQDVR